MCCFTYYVKENNIGIHSDTFEYDLIWFKLGILTYLIPHFDASVCERGLDSRSTGMQENNFLCQLQHKVLNRFGCNVVYC